MPVLLVTDIITEAPDTYSYVLQAAGNEPVPFQAGQFLTVQVTVNGRNLRRSYSFSSWPAENLLQITVKRVENGAVSRYLIDHLQRGSVIDALPPSGRFVLPATTALPPGIVCIAAGSGITPVRSLIGAVLTGHPATGVTLLTQFHDEAGIIFHDQLRSWTEQFPQRFRWRSFLSHSEEKAAGKHRLNNEQLEAILRRQFPVSPVEPLFFICGPQPFMRMAAFTLHEMGFTEDQVRREVFAPPREPAPWFHLDPAPHQVTFLNGDNRRQFSVAFPETLLDAALRHGVAIPFSCRAGICSTCVVRCVSGTVRMRLNEVLTPADLDNRLVLTCTGHPVTDLVLSFD